MRRFNAGELISISIFGGQITAFGRLSVASSRPKLYENSDRTWDMDIEGEWTRAEMETFLDRALVPVRTECATPVEADVVSRLADLDGSPVDTHTEPLSPKYDHDS